MRPKDWKMLRRFDVEQPEVVLNDTTKTRTILNFRWHGKRGRTRKKTHNESYMGSNISQSFSAVVRVEEIEIWILGGMVSASVGKNGG
jgi:hypothetical protein